MRFKQTGQTCTATNNLIYCALVRAKIHSTIKPTGLSCSDGKCPDGFTLIPWSAGKNITWEVTVDDTLTASYIRTTSKTADGATEIAVRKSKQPLFFFWAFDWHK